MQIENQIKNYIAQNLLFSETYSYDDDTSFLREGILDSVGVMELVTFVESSFALRIAPFEVTPDNFDSVSKLAGFIRRKQAAPAQSALPRPQMSGTSA